MSRFSRRFVVRPLVALAFIALIAGALLAQHPGANAAPSAAATAAKAATPVAFPEALPENPAQAPRHRS